MATKTIAERVVDAYHVGREAIFHDDDVNDTGQVHEFTPDGLKDYILGVGIISTADVVTTDDWAADGAAIVALINELKAKINDILG